jgi:hypothetical protein
MKMMGGVIVPALRDVSLLRKHHPWDYLNVYHEPENPMKGEPTDPPDVNSKIVS